MTVSEGDLLRATLRYTYPSAGLALNIFEFVYGGIDKDDEEVLDGIEAWALLWGAIWNELSPAVAELDAVDLVAIDSLGVVIRDLGTAVLGVVGTVPGEVSPAAVAGYVLANTDIPQVRASKYLPGMAEGVIEDGEFNVAAIADLVLILAHWITPYNFAGGGTIFSGVLSSKTTEFELLGDAGTVNSIPAYQRRRKRGVGS